MILRRLSIHIKEQNWFAVVLDFLIVVLGVFMALQVQEWAAHRAKAAESQEYFMRLGKEFTELSIAQREASNKYDIYYRNGINFTALLVNSENNDKGDKDDNATLSTLAGETFFVVTPQQIPAVLQEMISAGKLGLIKDSELRASLLKTRHDILRLDKFADYLSDHIGPITDHLQRCFVVSSFESLDDNALLPDELSNHAFQGSTEPECLRSGPMIRVHAFGWLSALSRTRLFNNKTAEQFEDIAKQLTALSKINNT